jgi:hypothetical protein
VPCEKPIRPTTRPPDARMRCTVLRSRVSTSGAMSGDEDPVRMASRETFSAGGSQRAKGPQPVKKGRTPGPAAEGKGAVDIG